MKRSATVAGVVAVAVLGIAIVNIPSADVYAQSGTRNAAPRGNVQGSQAGTTPQARQPFEAKLWDWLQKSQYQNWSPLPGVSGEAYEGKSPHGDMVKLYANRTAGANPSTLPKGSILIKENYGADGTTLMAVTLMYRSEGYDPEHGDWFWAKYDADGQVSQMNGMKVAGKVSMCIECHSSAGGSDYSFSNDRE